jgi:uncharacterized phosphosugar-binding protein
MSLAEQYFETVRRQIERIGESQFELIQQVGANLAEVLIGEGWVYAFGTGHSHMLAEELFYRAGGLARIKPILVSPLMLHESASESSVLERDPAWVDKILNRYPMQLGDMLLIASNSGRNAVPVELALRANALDVPVVALINREHSEAFPSRHPSGKRLGDVADIVIDNCGVAGDACVEVPGTGLATGAASTVTGALVFEMMACHAIDVALARGWKAELFCSSNAGREGHNEALIERYRSLVEHL